MISSQFVGYFILVITNLYLLCAISMILIYPWLSVNSFLHNIIFIYIEGVLIFPAIVLLLILTVNSFYIGLLMILVPQSSLKAYNETESLSQYQHNTSTTDYLSTIKQD